MDAKKKNPNAVALGSRGGKARAEKLSASALTAIGKKGAKARLSKLTGAERQEVASKAGKARWARAKNRGKK